MKPLNFHTACDGGLFFCSALSLLARCCVRRIAATMAAIGGIADKRPTGG